MGVMMRLICLKPVFVMFCSIGRISAKISIMGFFVGERLVLRDDHATRFALLHKPVFGEGIA